MSATDYWQVHQVGGPYETLAESNAALVERVELYPTLYELMPIDYRGKVVFDYGCGPGHDTLLFALNQAKRVYYYDVSFLAMQMTQRRLAMYGLADYAKPLTAHGVPIVDHVHCAGVLHHTGNPWALLKRMRRALANGGDARVMIYDGDRSEHTQSDVPITHWWGEDEFKEMAQQADFTAEYLGSYECSAPWRPNCYAACYALS